MTYEMKISVIIPTFNSRPLVVHAIESVLAQTRPTAEIIVVDDGSTDGTLERLEEFDGRITYLYQENRGRSAARNRGIRKATGDYVAFLDADDIWYPTKLEIQMEALSHYPEVKWTYGQTRLVDEQGNPLKSTFWPDAFGAGRVGAHEVLGDLLAGGIEISTSTVVVERASLFEVGLFDESLRSGEDTHLWVRLAQNIGPLLYIPEQLATRRVGTSTSFLERFFDYGYAETTPRLLKSNISQASRFPEMALLARKALCGAYLDSAFIELTQSRVDVASHYWCEASSWSEAGQFGTLVATRLAIFALSAARYHRDGPKEAERILQSLISEVKNLHWGKWQTARIAQGELFAAIAHMYMLKQQTAEMTAYARRALCANSCLFRNIGLLKRSLGLY